MRAIFGEIMAFVRYSSKNLCSIIGPMEHYRVRDGVQRRIHKEYVDVVAHFTKGGDFEPIAVCWKDGRTFPIDEIVETGIFGPLKYGKEDLKYLPDTLRRPRDGVVSGAARGAPDERGARDAEVVGVRLRLQAKTEEVTEESRRSKNACGDRHRLFAHPRICR